MDLVLLQTALVQRSPQLLLSPTQDEEATTQPSLDQNNIR